MDGGAGNAPARIRALVLIRDPIRALARVRGVVIPVVIPVVIQVAAV